MKCSQCDRPAVYQVAPNIVLCLPCYAQAQDIELRQEELNFRKALYNAAMINRAEQDIAAVVGMPVPQQDLIPVAAIANATTRISRMTNITVTGSQIGVLNAGDLAKIDAVVTITKGSDAEQLGLAIKALTEAVIQTQDIAADTKKEIGELLAALTEQISGKRSKSVAMQVLKGVEERTKGINAVWSLVEHVGTLLSDLF